MSILSDRKSTANLFVPICSNCNHSNLVRFHGQFMVISQPEMCTLFQLLRQIPLKSKKRGTSFGDSQQEWNRWHESIIKYNSLSLMSPLYISDWRRIDLQILKLPSYKQFNTTSHNSTLRITTTGTWKIKLNIIAIYIYNYIWNAVPAVSWWAKAANLGQMLVIGSCFGLDGITFTGTSHG